MLEIFKEKAPATIKANWDATVGVAERSVRPAIMISTTTILALSPVLTSTGRGSDVLVPMAIPLFGGMMLAILSIFVVPIFYCARLKLQRKTATGLVLYKLIRLIRACVSNCAFFKMVLAKNI